MEKVISLVDFRANIKTYLIDFSLLLFIYFLPALSHLFSFPVYYLDPMRIALVVALIHTSKKNTFLIALTLPLFSFLISSHPQFIKSFLLSTELIINLSLFFLFKEKIKNVFTSLLLSIILSKAIYYLLKFAFISFALLDDRLFSTPFYFQIISASLLSIYVYLANRDDIKSGN
ncbi:MAG: hypothetical protein Q8M94_21645 [Ignavibacteria bacterium]|nr:hypothetical protein [Ignavibacteria bacterium]